MGTHPIFESDFDCLTDFGYKKIKWPHARERRKRSKRSSHSDQRSPKVKMFLALPMSTPHSTIPSSMSPICLERKPWSVSLVVWRSRLIVMSLHHTLLCWPLKTLPPVPVSWVSLPFTLNSVPWVVHVPSHPVQVLNKPSVLWPVLV